jgi:hypothetical protein
MNTEPSVELDDVEKRLEFHSSNKLKNIGV